MTAAGKLIHLKLPDAAYDIQVRPGLLRDVGSELRKLTKSHKVAVLTDSIVGPLHSEALLASLQNSDFQPILATIPAGESHKNLHTLLPVYDEFLGSRIERSTPVIALGGGVIGDMAGFVAATVLRGVPFIQIPTTLLAMVDASVGGKTGVDHATGKNLIGAFHQPKAVFIDPGVLRTLPDRELVSGLAECIKHECIRDAEGFTDLEKNISRALALDMGYLTALIAHNVAIKARVVELDPFEKADRAHLNFGHTFGHAIESVSNYTYSHGESIALGITAATYVSTKLGLLAESDRQRIRDLIRRANLPTGGLSLDATAVVDAMFFDKKVQGGKLRFVLLDRIGHAIIRDDIEMSLVREAIESLRVERVEG